MDTTTQEPPKHPTGHGSTSGSAPQAIDPEHDMDAKTTITWLAVSVVFVVISLLVLAQAFGFAVQVQQGDKVERLPAKELHALRVEEDYYFKNPGEVTADAAPPSTADAAAVTESIRASTNKIIDAYVSK